MDESAKDKVAKRSCKRATLYVIIDIRKAELALKLTFIQLGLCAAYRTAASSGWYTIALCILSAQIKGQSAVHLHSNKSTK